MGYVAISRLAIVVWSAAAFLAGCVLPEIERGAPPLDAGPAVADPALSTPVDPRDDPANRFEDLATFYSLLPPAHLFAEWPMPDTKPAAPHELSASGNVVTDNLTKLRWQRVLPTAYPGCKGRHLMATKLYGEGSGCNWEEAQAYCTTDKLAQSLGGGKWRLPTRVELETILDYSRTPTIPPIFESDQDDFYWTISPAPNPEGVKLSWALDFMDGYSYMTGRFKEGRVRCVSSESESGGHDPKYDIQQLLVVDWSTRLTWQRISDSSTRTWEEARAYCEALDIDSAGWRLPSLKELLTIVDARRHNPALEPRAFLHSQSDRFWADTTFLVDTEQAYAVEFMKGESGYYPKSYKHFVRCVR